jgi:hypothetical protein
MRFVVQGLGCRVQDVHNLRSRVQCLEFMFEGLGSRVQGLW